MHHRHKKFHSSNESGEAENKGESSVNLPLAGVVMAGVLGAGAIALMSFLNSNQRSKAC